jgi:FkbM family methyltransferase
MYSIEQFRNLLRPWRHRQRSAQAFRKIAHWISKQADLRGPVLYDIGARWGASPPYDRLAKIPGFHSVAFEPDADEAEKLRKNKSFDRVCPVALGSRAEKRKLYIARDPGSSSLFPPNASEYARHTTWREFETVGVADVSVEPLDHVIAKCELPPPDFMKIDCEGAEGEILDGASRALSGLCGLAFEARLRNFYHEETATFSQLAQRMFERNFVCLSLDPIGSWFGTVMMFDAVMVRHPDSICDRRQFILCVLFCLLHGNWQYAQRTAALRARDFDCLEVRSLLKLK